MDNTPTVVNSTVRIHETNGPKYPSIWQDNQYRICTAAFAALGIFASILMAHPGFFIAFSVLEIGIVHCIRNVYKHNIGKADYDYSKTLTDEDVKFIWLRKSAMEHRLYPPALRDYGLRINSEHLLQEASNLGDSIAKNALDDADNLARFSIPQLERLLKVILTMNPEVYNLESKAKMFVTTVNNLFSKNPLERKIFSNYRYSTVGGFIEDQLKQFQFPKNIQQKILLAIQEHKPFEENKEQ